MTEPFLYVVDAVALCNHQRSAGMPQIVKTDIFETVLLEYFLEGTVNVIRIVQYTHRINEYVPIIGVIVAIPADLFVFLLLFL